MNQPNFITVQEANNKTGKSKSTLNRLIKTIEKDTELSKKVLRKEPTKSGKTKFKYLISVEYLREKFEGKKEKQKTEQSEPKSKKKIQSKIEVQKPKIDDQNKSREVELLENQIAGLKEDKKELQGQLKEKDEQINGLLEGGKELRILLVKEQDLQNKNILNIDIKRSELSEKNARGSETGKTARSGIDGLTFLVGLVVVLVISALMIAFSVGW